jgi:hypothetical protein
MDPANHLGAQNIKSEKMGVQEESMARRRVTLPDGRYLIFFSFLAAEDAAPSETSRGGRETV